MERGTVPKPSPLPTPHVLIEAMRVFVCREDVVLLKRVTILNAVPQGRAGLPPLLPESKKAAQRP